MREGNNEEHEKSHLGHEKGENLTPLSQLNAVKPAGKAKQQVQGAEGAKKEKQALQ